MVGALLLLAPDKPADWRAQAPRKGYFKAAPCAPATPSPNGERNFPNAWLLRQAWLWMPQRPRVWHERTWLVRLVRINEQLILIYEFPN